MPAPTHPSNLQRRIHAGGGRVLEQRKSIGVRIHTTPQVGADGKPAEAPHRRAHGDDYPLELRSGLTNRLMTIGTCYWVDLHKGADAGLRSEEETSALGGLGGDLAVAYNRTSSIKKKIQSISSRGAFSIYKGTRN